MAEESVKNTENTAPVAVEGKVKTPNMEVEKKVVAPALNENKPADAPDEKDISDVITFLNEVDSIAGGKGGITEIPPQLLGSIKYLTQVMTNLRDSYKDPLFQDVLDDMQDQAADGNTPSLLVAVARNVPIEQIQELADNEAYGDVQKAVGDRVSADKTALEDDEKLFGNFEESQKNIDAYATEMGYDEAQKAELFTTIALWRDVFADGLITRDELEKIDHQINYKPDTEALRGQIPEAPVKEQIPDNASLQATMDAKPIRQAASAPKNAIEAMAAGGGGMTDITNIGKRRFLKQ